MGDACVQVEIYTNVKPHTHARTYARTHAHTHSCTHTRTHIHTHTNVPRLDEEDEFEEGGKGGRGSNPFQRNFRKSMFRDGPVFSNWMERMHEYGIEVCTDAHM